MGLERIMTEPEYREVDAISYSVLSGVSKSPASLLNTAKFESPYLTYGSAVDVLCFDGEEKFKKKFTINVGVSPSSIVEKITRDVMKAVEEANGSLIGTLDDYDSLILDVAKANEYGKGWHDPTILRKVKDEGGRDLFTFIQENEGKQILDTIQYENVLNSRNTLYTHPFSKQWFNIEGNQQLLFQFPILWVYKGKKCKSLFDIIKIDHDEKVIYPVDLKTSYDYVLGFPFNFLKWKYYLQASFYTEALIYWKLQHPEFLDYRIDLFRFVIISSQDPMKPLVYKTTPEDIYVGKYGGKLQRTGEEVKGFDTLIDDMQWHLDNQLFDYPREVYEANGELNLSLF